MYYAISGVNNDLYSLKDKLNHINNKDNNAKFIFIGNIFYDSYSWDTLSWFMHNITPSGKYQAVLNQEGDFILEWYHNKFLKWQERSGSVAYYPCVDREDSLILSHLKTLSSKELQEVVNFYKSLPVVKKLFITTETTTYTCYCVESWVKRSTIRLLENQPENSYDKRCLKESCLYYPVSGSNYTDDRYMIARANYNDETYNIRDTISLGNNRNLNVFCFEKEQFI